MLNLLISQMVKIGHISFAFKILHFFPYYMIQWSSGSKENSLF